MSTQSQQPFIAYEHGQGELLSSGAQIVGRAEWTDGAFITIRSSVAPGFFSPVHKHADQSQTSVVLSGTLGFWVQDEEPVTLAAGGYVFRPMDRYHAFWNATDQPAEVLEITSPASAFQDWMLDLSAMMAGDGASREEVAKRAAQAGITFAPELTERITAQVGVTASNVFGR